MTKHTKEGFCQECWDKAFLRSVNSPTETQYSEYLKVIKEEHDTSKAKAQTEKPGRES